MTKEMATTFYFIKKARHEFTYWMSLWLAGKESRAGVGGGGGGKDRAIAVVS